MARLALRELCGYRSGDKGNTANLALFADDEETYALLRREVTAERVRTFLSPLVAGPVVRYEAPNVLALNFVCADALAGGGAGSLRSDNLGKTLAGTLLRMEIDVPAAWAGRRRPRPDLGWLEALERGEDDPPAGRAGPTGESPRSGGRG